jgi:hypothetical protein
MGRMALICAAIGAALAPIPAAAVERLYSNALYLALQRTVTAVSNLLPFAVFDALLVSAAAAWTWLLVRDAARRGGWTRIAGRTVRRTVTPPRRCILVFLITWGLNYRRVPLAEKLEFDAGSVSAAGARTWRPRPSWRSTGCISRRTGRRTRQWIRRSPVHSTSRKRNWVSVPGRGLPVRSTQSWIPISSGPPSTA